MKGVLFKYDADPDDTLMRDNQAECGADICGMMDPDFWTNNVPVWSICGPYIRQGLEKGDMIFYLPKKASIEKTSLTDYICTGVIIVGDILRDYNAAISDPQLTDDYKNEYLIDLENHIKQDKPKTRRIRGRKIIKGDPNRFKWFGRNRFYLRDILKSLDFIEKSESLDYQRIPYLKRTETLTLYNKLIQLHTNFQV